MPWTAAPLAALNGSKQWGTRAKLAHPIDHRQKDAHDLNGKVAQREYRKTTRSPRTRTRAASPTLLSTFLSTHSKNCLADHSSDEVRFLIFPKQFLAEGCVTRTHPATPWQSELLGSYKSVDFKSLQ